MERVARRLIGLWLLVLALVPAGCTAQKPAVVLRNGSTLALTVAVNGTAMGTYGSGETRFEPSSLGAFPWHVEARTATGRVVVSVDVPGSPNEGETFFGRVDLSCGSVYLFTLPTDGTIPPLGPPPASPAGKPGDCEP